MNLLLFALPPHYVHQVLHRGFPIEAHFRNCSSEIIILYLKGYLWYYKMGSVGKILTQGAKIDVGAVISSMCIYTGCPGGECARLRENVPYVKVHRSNPKHLYPKLNGYGVNGQRKVWSSCGSTYCTCFACCYPYTARPSFSLTAESSTFRLHYQQKSQLQ